MQTLKEEVKKRILDAGKKRFRADGFDKASMKDIANDAGISAGNIYRYFLTKSHLLDEILNDLEVELKDFLNAIPEEYESLKGNMLFKLISDKIAELYENKEAEVKILFNCREQKQFIIFREKMLGLLSKKIEAIGRSIDERFGDEVLSAAIARSLFEGLAYIVCTNDGNISELKKKMYIYTELMVLDLDKRVLDIVKRVK